MLTKLLTLLKSATSEYSYYIEGLVLVLFIAFCCWLTWDVTDSKWQTKWDQNVIAEQQATQKLTDEYRQKEKDSQDEIDRISADGAAKLAAAQADAQKASASVASANASIERLRQQINAAITSSSAAANSKSPGIGYSATSALNLLTNVLGQSIERNRQLAAFADQAWNAGRTCEQSYNAIIAEQNEK